MPPPTPQILNQGPLKHSLVKTISTRGKRADYVHHMTTRPTPWIFSPSYGPAAASHRHSNWEWNHDLPSKLFEVEKRDFCAPSLKVNPDCCPCSRLHIQCNPDLVTILQKTIFLVHKNISFSDNLVFSATSLLVKNATCNHILSFNCY